MTFSARSWRAAVVLLILTAGCASRSTNAGTSASEVSGVASTTVAGGTVTGVVRVYGGPMMPDGHMAADGNPGQGTTVTAVRQGNVGEVLASMVTGVDGVFRFSLPPGSYLIRGCDDVTITVTAGSVIHQDLTCQVP